MKNILLGLLGSFLLFGCQTSKKANYSANDIVPKDKTLLWKIQGNGLKKPSYLFGTIHLIPKEDLTFSDKTLNALKHTDQITFEIDMKEMTNLRTQISLMSKAFMGGGKTLRDLMSPEDYAFIRTKMDEKGLPLTMMERMKPMFLSTMFGTDENSGVTTSNMTSVEVELYKRAKKQKKPSAGLETATYQMAIFDSIPYEVQAKMLIESLRSTEKGDGEFGKMIEMYLDQNIAEMQSMVTAEDSGMKNFEEILLNRRNRNWLAPMRRMMLDKPTFFAVGAGHLGGTKGVIALLRKEGYSVEPER